MLFSGFGLWTGGTLTACRFWNGGFLGCAWTSDAFPTGPILEAAIGAIVPSRNQLGTECGLKSTIAHETLILEAGKDFSTCTCVNFKISLRNFHAGGIDSFEKSIPWRNQFLLINQCLGICFWNELCHTRFAHCQGFAWSRLPSGVGHREAKVVTKLYQ